MALFSEGLLDHLKLHGKEIGIIFVTDEKIKEYNKKFLGHDWATDVIAFGYDDSTAGSKDINLEPDHLGDIVISVETAASNAARYNLSLSQELKNLILHGVLHLLGYDHETDRGEMRRLERKWRRKLIR